MMNKVFTTSLVILVSMSIFCFPSDAQETQSSREHSETPAIAFKITDRTVQQLNKQETPEDVLTALETLEDQLFSTEEQFLSVLEDTLGKEVLEQHKTEILKAAYLYDEIGRREPFKPPFEPEGPGEPTRKLLAGEICPPPLGLFDAGQFQIIGIVLGEPGDRARIKSPDGNSYTISVETCIGKFAGKVVSISENCVTIRETKRYKKDNKTVIEEPETELCLKPTEKE